MVRSGRGVWTAVIRLSAACLAALVADARRDPARIAALTGIAEDQVVALVGQLERQRVIRGYKTVVDWDRLGDERVVAFIDVSVSPQREVGFDQVAARIYRHPEVRSAHLVSGGHDLRIIVEAPTMREIAQFVSGKAGPDRPRHRDEHPLPAQGLQGGRRHPGRGCPRPTAACRWRHEAAGTVSSTMRLSRAVTAVPPSGIRQFFDVVSQMEDVISLGVGEPDFGTAWRVREAAIYGLERGRTTYTANSGLLDLRSAVASSLAGRYGLEYDPETRS